MLLASALGIYWLLEQPLSSLMIFHPRLQDIVKNTSVWQVSFNMSQFGSASQKPTKLYSNAEWVADIANAEPHLDEPVLERPETFVRYFDARGNPKVKGGRDLKLTQEYTRMFGVEVRRAWRARARRELRPRPNVEQNPDGLREMLRMGAGVPGLLVIF